MSSRFEPNIYNRIRESTGNCALLAELGNHPVAYFAERLGASQLAAFDPERGMFECNFPVDKGGCGHAAL
jgi:hypothetical protein